MIRELFSSNDFMPHGFCYQWKPLLVWLHSISDTLIATAYFSIPPTLLYLVRKKRNIPFDWMFVCFGVFIAACGATHFMEVVTLWIPLYWISGGVKVITALASLPTAFLLARIVPQALNLPSAEDMRAANEELKRQAATLREQAVLLDLSQDAVIVETIAGTILSWNQGAERMYGWPKAEAIGQSKQDLLQTSFPQPRKAILEKLLTTGYWEGELQQLRHDGQTIIVSSRWALGRSPDGGPQNILKIDTDVTEHRRAEDALRDSEERFRQMAENIEEIFWLLDPKTLEALYVSPAFEQICERPVASINAAPLSYREIIHPDDTEGVLEKLAVLEKTGEFSEQFRIVCPSGNVKWVEVRGFTAKDSGGNVKALVGTAQDITERRRAEAALRESEDRYRDLVENSQDLICTHSPEGILLSINEAPLRILGYTREEMLNKPLRDFVTPETRPLCDAYLAQVQLNGSAKGILPVMTKSGEVRLWEYNNSVRRNGLSQPIVRGVAHDVTEQKFAERALRRSEEKFSKIFQSSPTAICITTLATGRFVDINEGFEQQTQFHREELIDHTSLELGMWVDPAQRKAIVDEISAGKAIRSRELQFRDKTGEIKTKLYSAEPIQIGPERCLLAVAEDITQRKRDEEKLREYEKVIEDIDEMIAVVGRDYRYLLANRAFVSYRGMEKDQVLGRLVSDVLDSAYFLNTVKEQLDECFQGRIVRYETRYTYPKIGTRDLFISYFPIEGPTGADRAVCILQDITERKRAEESIQQLSGRLLRLQDEERRKIARDLHDTTGQDLVAVSATLGQLTSSIASSNRKSRKLVAQCQALVDRCIREVRTLSYVLYPPMLEEAGLEDAIHHYVEGFSERTGIEVTLDISPRFERLSREMELGLFRVVQESLINIQRHSGSFTARIGLDRDEGRIVLTVSDQGRGISASKRKGNGAVPVAIGVGIPSMYERVKQIGGRLDIESSELGTTVRVIIPIHD